MAIDHTPNTDFTVARLIVEQPRLTITGPLTLEVPDTSRHLEDIPEPERHLELCRIAELGTRAIETIQTSTTLRLVETQIAGLSQELNAQLAKLLLKDRLEASKLTRELLDGHKLKVTQAMTRYLDPESQASLPVAMGKVFDQAMVGFQKRMEALLSEEGDDSAFGRLATRFTTELEKATTLVIEQMAARRALTTRSALAGRPYEDALEERLMTLVRATGDTVTRCGDTLGQMRRRQGDMLITINKEQTGGHELRIVVEAKRRAATAQSFTAADMRQSLAASRENRVAQAGIFVVESASVLPLEVGFQELTSCDLAIAYDPAGDDLALAVAIRLLRFQLLATVASASTTEVDREAGHRLIGDIRQALTKLELLRGQHQAAINAIGKASTAANGLVDDVLGGLRKLDDLLGT